MARHVPVRFSEKLARVALSVGVARGDDRRHFDLGGEVEPGVRLVLSEVSGAPLALSLWSYPADIAEICGDAAYPATAALLAIDRDQAHELSARGVTVDLGQFTRSESYPGIYYALFDHSSKRQIHTVLHRLVPALTPHRAAA
jgi:hypothetical protein